MTSLLIFLAIVGLAVIARLRTVETESEERHARVARPTTTPTMKKIGDEVWRHVKNKWQVVLGVVGCYVALAYFFPATWLWLINQPIFWADQLVIGFVLLSLMENKGTELKPRREVNGFGFAILCILVLGNLAEAPGLYAEYANTHPTPPSTHTSSSSSVVPPDKIMAPVGRRSERFVTNYGTRIEPEGPIIIWDDQGRPYKDDKGANIRIAQTSWVELESGTSKEVVVKIIPSR